MGAAGVVAAAGLSSRMGAFKPLLPYRGKTVIESTVDLLKDSGAEKVFVVVGWRGDEIAALFADEPSVCCLRNPDYDNGDMFTSVRMGLAAAAEYDHIFFLPGDMPAVEPELCRALWKALSDNGSHWARPVYHGRGQHPVLLEREAAARVLAYQGSGGLRGALRALPWPPMELAAESVACEIDIDTPTEYDFLLRYTADREK